MFKGLVFFFSGRVKGAISWHLRQETVLSVVGMAKVIGETVSDGYKVIFNPTNLLTWSVLAKTMFCLKSYLQSVTCTMPKASFPMETHSTGMFWNSIKWYELQVLLCAAVVVSPPLSSSYYLPVFIVSSRLFFVVTLTGNLSFLIIKNLEAEIMVQIVGGVILNLKNKQGKKTKKKKTQIWEVVCWKKC